MLRTTYHNVIIIYRFFASTTTPHHHHHHHKHLNNSWLYFQKLHLYKNRAIFTRSHSFCSTSHIIEHYCPDMKMKMSSVMWVYISFSFSLRIITTFPFCPPPRLLQQTQVQVLHRPLVRGGCSAAFHLHNKIYDHHHVHWLLQTSILPNFALSILIIFCPPPLLLSLCK